MKYKFTGEGEITLRGVTFAKGKAVDLADNPALAEKVANMPEFKEVKARGNKG